MLKLKGWVKKHKPDVVVEDLNKLPFYSPLVYKGPLVIQMHHLWRTSIFRETVFPMALFIWLSEEMIRFAYRKCSFSVVSESTQKELLAMGISAEQIKVIYNGADLERYQPSEISKEPFLIWIGRIQKYKGPHDACQVLKRLLPEFPDLKLVIVGDGPYRSQLEEFVSSEGLEDKVTLTGFISEEEKIDLLQRASVHFQSSYKEGWGLSVIEANCCGCPVVANDTTGLRDSCRDNENGLLYKHCDIEDGASKVRKMLTDDALRERLVEKGYEWGGSFSWERNQREILDYLQEAIDA